jgi:hypothetical protein
MWMKNALIPACLLSLSACASHGGRGLVAGVASEDDVLRVMGTSAMEWTNPDGTRQLAYPRGPMGVRTDMVRVAPDGRVSAIENALTPATFSRIRAGMSADAVLYLLGPSEPGWTVHYQARDELAWEWRYCDDHNQLARFAVLLDGTTRTVRSTLTQSEDAITNCGGFLSCWCTH